MSKQFSNETFDVEDEFFGNTRLRAETSKFDSPGDRRLFITTGLDKPTRGYHAPRALVEEFRDFLTKWLEETEPEPVKPGVFGTAVVNGGVFAGFTVDLGDLGEGEVGFRYLNSAKQSAFTSNFTNFKPGI